MPDLPEVKKRDYPLRRGNTYYIEFEGQQLVLPSVTHILGKAIPKPALVRWAAKTAAQAVFENPGISIEEAVDSLRNVKVTATDKGKLIHSWAEAYGKGNPPDIQDVPELLIPYANAVASFFESEKIHPKVIEEYPLVEFTVFNVTHGYAGTVDFANNHIYDWKTGKGVYKEGELQQTAYLNAEYVYIPAKDGRTKPKVVPMPKFEGAFLVHLRDDGGYSKIEVREPFANFLTTLNMFKMIQGWGE